ncbi:MAG TPA: UvrD-helicase domain-containing protein [Actinomycetota bacterium]|nr:UvrD-helicase domain-containing protein [Actinomycetota bacterium]
MRFYADLHIHSKHSRACSQDLDIPGIAHGAKRKGITVVGTGDFTHPGWFEELRATLVAAEPGLFRLRDDLERAVDGRLPPSCQRPVRFLLSVEISTIYKRADRTRKVHHLLYMPDLGAAAACTAALRRIGNLAADGRPILGLDSRDLLEITLESGDGAYLVPAHIWTPWFSPLGSKSGFDAVEDCYADLAGHLFALETGLSADPAMCWRVSALDRYRLVSNSDAHSPGALGREATVLDTELDYFAIREALKTGEGFGGTVEFFPEEGKYHVDGHRKCGVRLEPAESRRLGDRCPVCGKPLTVGVLHRVEELADRPEGFRPPGAAGFRNLIQLPQLVGEVLGVGPKSKGVGAMVAGMVERLGPELEILERVPVEAIAKASVPLVAEAVDRVRRGAVVREPGYDGEYGVLRVFDPEELRAPPSAATLFEPEPAPSPAPVAPAAEAAPSPAGASRPAAAAAAPAAVLEGLDPDQRAAAAAPPGPLLIMAGPGTGKTRTLTHRLAHLVGGRGVAPEQCLAITFTRRACAELQERLDALVPAQAPRMLVTTFHGLGLRILRELHEAVGLGPGFRVADEAERLEVLREQLGCGEREARRLLPELVARKRARAARWPDLDPEPSEVAAPLARYEAALRKLDLVDLDDLLVLPVMLLAADATVAARYRDRYRLVAVDEYQDVDELQYRLLRLLTTPEANLFVIGDPDQAIYGFRGAEVGFFLRFAEDFPAATTVRLTRNYRSSPAIVAGALQAIAPSTLVAERELAAAAGRDAPTRITIHQAASELAEAEFVVQSIDRLLGGASFLSLDSGRADGGADHGLSFADVAVLCRTDAQSGPLAEALGRAGMPFQKRSHDRLGDRPAVRALVRGLRDPGSPAAAAGDRGGGSLAARLAAAAAAAGDEADEALELLAPLAERCGDDLDRFLAELALGDEVDTWDPRADRVSLLTLHAAKGLEFPVVFLAGCEDGLLPLWFGPQPSPEEVAEERRLFFVGMTRARSHLFLSHARRRAWRGMVREAGPSPFLADLEAALVDHAHAPARPRRPQPTPGDQLSLL